MRELWGVSVFSRESGNSIRMNKNFTNQWRALPYY